MLLANRQQKPIVKFIILASMHFFLQFGVLIYTLDLSLEGERFPLIHIYWLTKIRNQLFERRNMLTDKFETIFLTNCTA